MRRLILILEAVIVVAGAALAQSTTDNSAAPQLPVGQVFKQFEFPAYQDGKLKYTLFATEAKGVTLNRADTTDLKIQIYDDGAVTTTITSPKADLLVAEQRMRTKNTVQIERADMEATSQNCDFDVKSKKFVMRNNVKVVLKHFDLSGNGSGPGHTPAAALKTVTPARITGDTTPAPTRDTTPMMSAPAPVPASMPEATVATPSQAPDAHSSPLPTAPGTYGDTNSAPIPPSSSDSK